MIIFPQGNAARLILYFFKIWRLSIFFSSASVFIRVNPWLPTFPQPVATIFKIFRKCAPGAFPFARHPPLLAREDENNKSFAIRALRPDPKVPAGARTFLSAAPCRLLFTAIKSTPAAPCRDPLLTPCGSTPRPHRPASARFGGSSSATNKSKKQSQTTPKFWSIPCWSSALNPVNSEPMRISG